MFALKEYVSMRCFKNVVRSLSPICVGVDTWTGAAPQYERTDVDVPLVYQGMSCHYIGIDEVAYVRRR